MILKTFGRLPSGDRLEKIKRSVNYKNDIFENLSKTVMMLEDVSMLKMMGKLLNKPKYTVPPKAIPYLKTDLRNINSEKPCIVWFGHSSYLIKINNKNILIDPVFGGNASPFSFMVKAFKGSNEYSVDQMPEIDILILTHDHYDHLDHKTIIKLKDKVKSIYCSLGVGSHLEYWGIDKTITHEMDWWDKQIIGDIELTAAPARHFSGRGLTRAKTLWSSFILKTKEYNLYLGGDSGYDRHFKEIGDKYGPFDIAILECGQYNTDWPLIHMMPEQNAQASLDLKAKVLLPVHWGKFDLAFHPWDEPIKRLVKSAKKMKVKVTTPMIGEPVVLDENYPANEWWENI